jgi:putative ABC transport system substrate-binding protein
MDRRRFLVGAIVGALGTPLRAAAQSTDRAPRVGYLSPVSAGSPGHVIFRQSLRDLGYVDGISIKLHERFADGHSAVRAVKGATTAIPVVMIVGDDPVRSGFVESLAHPGANLTGVTFQVVDLFAKQMELLKAIVPGLKRLAFLWDPTMPTKTEDLVFVGKSGQTLGVTVQVIEARGAGDYMAAFDAMTKEGAQALVIAGSPTFIQDRTLILGLSRKHRVPAAAPLREDAEDGALVSYGARQAEVVRLAARYVDRILKGARPADLPIEQASKFELVINLKTAKALGLTIPPSLLARADQIIE